ncbi:hypothetical protein AMTRI_Chr10g231130 [Amborella trichopoda]
MALARRRFLTLPAVAPCPDIDPAALLSSLIRLSRTICTTYLPTHRRDARELIRQTTTLLLLFDELSDHHFSSTALLALSELHFTLQKLNFLLHDCCRPGARLWLALNSRRLSHECRSLSRDISVALDVLPLYDFEISPDVREHVALLLEQARRVQFMPEPLEEWAARDVIAVLSGFERGISPDTGDLRRILSRLRITSSTECADEICFLKEEVSGGEGSRDTDLVSGLIAFLQYSQSLVFDFSGNSTSSSEKISSSNKSRFCSNSISPFGERWTFSGDSTSFSGEFLKISGMNLTDFRCPISLEIMTDPVTISTGHTYDRISILQWLSAGNTTCPKTGVTLTHSHIFPNNAVHNLTHKVLRLIGKEFPATSTSQKQILPPIPAGKAAKKGKQILSEFLVTKLVAGISPENDIALQIIRQLVKSDPDFRQTLPESSVIPAIIANINCPSTQENAMASLLSLAKLPENRTDIANSGGICGISNVLVAGIRQETREFAAATLFYLAGNRELRPIIGEIPSTIPALVQLIWEGTTRGKKNAVAALLGLILYPGNHKKAISAGIIPALLHLLALDKKKELLADVLAVVVTLAEKPEGSAALIQAGAMTILARILSNEAPRSIKEYCVASLLSLCVNGGPEVVAELRREPSIMASLYSLQTSGSARPSKKASALLKFLHDFYPSSPNFFNQEARPGMQVVHAL